MWSDGWQLPAEWKRRPCSATFNATFVHLVSELMVLSSVASEIAYAQLSSLVRRVVVRRYLKPFYEKRLISGIRQPTFVLIIYFTNARTGVVPVVLKKTARFRPGEEGERPVGDGAAQDLLRLKSRVRTAPGNSCLRPGLRTKSMPEQP